ncbi:MAG: ATP-binding protein [Desulfococcaceae bacterium]|jgi:signal transduction histidine kinase|nr:ATP-binding protein [Desulfococcaceae bacterium]
MNRKIIVIDDDESILQDYRQILAPLPGGISDMEKEAAALEAELFGDTEKIFPKEEERYELSTALQGQEGWEQVRNAQQSGFPFALAFIDIRMPPGWDGVETACRIRESDPNIEIVIVTAYSDRDRQEIVKKVGVPEKLLYLKKPFDPEEIRQMALSLTRKWSLEQRAIRHRNYLERLLVAVRRLKTLSISSVRGVLTAILNEVLHLIDARKGFIAKFECGRADVEITSENIAFSDTESLVKKITSRLPDISDITRINGIMVLPLKDLVGNYFILVWDSEFPMSDDKLSLVRLLLETCSEVLENVRKQEQYLRNERIATIGQIAAGIIHEVNNPLTAIIGTTQMNSLYSENIWDLVEHCDTFIKDPDMPPHIIRQFKEIRQRNKVDKIRKDMSRNYEIIETGVERIRALMDNIRNFSKVSDDFDPICDDVGEALESTLILAHNAMNHGVTVHKNWESPLLARCDINGLRQVFLNLILNAVQAMDGKGDLWISGKEENEKIIISVRDSGPGIPAAERENIFKAFYTTKESGTGLGLSIVRGIINKHNGSIRAESEVGQGAVFHVEIPAGDI